MVIKVGSMVRTYDGHCGIVVKRYSVTGRPGMFVHIREADGRIYYCPESYIVKAGGWL